jgi:predicted CoA-binding protein
MKLTVVIGASPDPSRYSFLATNKLKRYGHKVYPVGIHEGDINGEPVLTNKPPIENVDTITMYVHPRHQKSWYDYILGLKPKRIIFNPGAENPELQKLAEAQGAECLDACTLVMLSTGEY